MTDTNGLTQDDIPRPGRRYPFGAASLILWSIAILCTVVDATYAARHIRVLIDIADLERLDIGGAVLASLLWYLDRHLLDYVTDWRVGSEYGYHIGFRDGHETTRDTDARLHLVEPAPPTPTDTAPSTTTTTSTDRPGGQAWPTPRNAARANTRGG